MSETTRKGAIAEALITAEAIKLGVVVLRPFADGGRYDLVFDVDGRLIRVQCKWGTRRGGVVVVYTCTSRHTPRGYVRTTYDATEVDAIAAYCPETDACYYVPIDEVAGRHELHLRLTPAANNQVCAVKYASDYTLQGAIAQLGERRHGMAEAGGSSPPSSTPRPLV
jgi:hypothetical protein